MIGILCVMFIIVILALTKAIMKDNNNFHEPKNH